MSFCVPTWGTRSGGMLNAVTPANDCLQLAPKGRGDSIRHQKAHLPDLASVPDQDTLELAWIENGDAENGHFDMQCPTSEVCNSELQVNYTANWGIGQGMEDTVLPSKSPGMLVNEASSVTAGDQALPIINVQDDEMISWLQDPPEDSLDQNYGVDFFGELPVTNIQGFPDAFSMQGMIGRSACTQPSGVSGNPGNYALATRDANADMAMTLGACRAAGLIRQGAGVEAFSQVRTLQALGTRQAPGITSSLSTGLGQGFTESQNPFKASSPMSGSPLAPMLPPKSKPVAAATSNSLPSNPLVEKSGAMNFPVFARPAALIKANLQSLNMASILPCNLMRFKPQQGRHVNLEASTSTSSSITELTTQGQSALQPQDGFLGTQNELEMQFEAAGSQLPNLGVGSLPPMPSSVSRKEVQAVASAGEAMYCGSEPKDQDAYHHSSGTKGNAVPASSDLEVSQTTSIPEAQEPTITSGSGGGVPTFSDPGVSQGTSIPEVQEPTITSALGGSGNSVLKRVVKETSTANKKKKLHVPVEEVACARPEHESLDLKKPARGSTAKRNRAAEVHNLSERRRRDRINEKMKSLQELIPNSNKTDKASMLDEAIEYIKMLQVQLRMMSMRCGVNLPPMVLPSGIQRMQMPQMPRMPQMAMSMGVGMGMGMGLGMGMVDMVDMAVTGPGQGLLPAMSFMGPVPHNRGVPSMMAEAHDACLVNANIMDPCKTYLTHQHQAAMQIQQPMNNEMYNAYILQQHQQQQQQQYQQYQLQQEHNQSFTMAASAPTKAAAGSSLHQKG